MYTASETATSPDRVIPRTFKVFVGACHAIALNTRGEKDDHVCVSILTEDDTNWFISKHDEFSSYWTEPLLHLLTEATEWMKKHCEPDMKDGKQYGWKVKA